MRGRLLQWCIVVSAMLASTRVSAVAIVDYPISQASYRWGSAEQKGEARYPIGSPAEGRAGLSVTSLLPEQIRLHPDDMASGDPFLRPLIDATVMQELSFRTAEDMRVFGVGALDAFDRSVKLILSGLKRQFVWAPIIADYREAVARLSVRSATWNTARLACIRRRSGGHGDVRLAPLAVYGWRC